MLSASDDFIRYLGITVEALAVDGLPDAKLEISGIPLPTAKILAAFESEYGELKDLFR